VLMDAIFAVFPQRTSWVARMAAPPAGAKLPA
jgi:hypothetical protein